MNYKMYMEQHKAIKEEMKALKELLGQGDITGKSGELALHVNTLAGKIRIHLMSEDQYLYPGLMKSGDAAKSKMAAEYQHEMGDLQEVFTKFKEHYNTKFKIEGNEKKFVKAAKEIILAIEKRVEKEEHGIYKIIE